MGYNHEQLIHVSIWTISLATVPLLVLALSSWYLGIGIESPICIGTVRTLIQLSILGMILDPIFERGIDMWGLVVVYVLFMITLASYESSVRCKYYFKHMFWYVMVVLLANVTIVSLFAFAAILQLDPLWDPQYVIPIIGMLLGNCINGVSLSLNSMLTSVVESSREIELMLSFGASSYEASSRLLKEAIRTGSMPQLNR
jgi:putative ABC transport system permease protein